MFADNTTSRKAHSTGNPISRKELNDLKSESNKSDGGQALLSGVGELKSLSASGDEELDRLFALGMGVAQNNDFLLSDKKHPKNNFLDLKHSTLSFQSLTNDFQNTDNFDSSYSHSGSSSKSTLTQGVEVFAGEPAKKSRSNRTNLVHSNHTRTTPRQSLNLTTNLKSVRTISSNYKRKKYKGKTDMEKQIKSKARSLEKLRNGSTQLGPISMELHKRSLLLSRSTFPELYRVKRKSSNDNDNRTKNSYKNTRNSKQVKSIKKSIFPRAKPKHILNRKRKKRHNAKVKIKKTSSKFKTATKKRHKKLKLKRKQKRQYFYNTSRFPTRTRFPTAYRLQNVNPLSENPAQVEPKRDNLLFSDFNSKNRGKIPTIDSHTFSHNNFKVKASLSEFPVQTIGEFINEPKGRFGTTDLITSYSQLPAQHAGYVFKGSNRATSQSVIPDVNSRSRFPFSQVITPPYVGRSQDGRMLSGSEFASNQQMQFFQPVRKNAIGLEKSYMQQSLRRPALLGLDTNVQYNTGESLTGNIFIFWMKSVFAYKFSSQMSKTKKISVLNMYWLGKKDLLNS